MRNKPEIFVFAGPNGSGKSTVTKMANIIYPYVNADDIKRANNCGDMEAAVTAERIRNELVDRKESFTFETVLSTDRNLKLIRRARENGYFIRCVYVLTVSPKVNINRIKSRTAAGGHDVPADKIVGRYYRALELLPQVIDACDICHIYDNSEEPFRIFKKRKDKYFFWENSFWSYEQTEKLTGIKREENA